MPMTRIPPASTPPRIPRLLLRVVHRVGLAHYAFLRKLDHDQLRFDALRLIAPDVAVLAGKLVYARRRAEQVAHVILAPARPDLLQVVPGKALLDRNQLAVLADGRRVAHAAPGKARKPQHRRAVRPRALLRNLAHDLLDFLGGRLAGHQVAAVPPVAARATSDDCDCRSH